MWRAISIALVPLMLLALPVSAQYRIAAPAWYWTDLDSEQAALWHNGVQVGAMMLDTLTYYPRYGPGRWGAPEDPPVGIPQKYRDTYARINRKKNRWREEGVMGPNGEREVPNSGLHINRRGKAAPKGKPSPPPKIRTYPQSALPAGANEVPAFDDMASITFVSSDDGSAADAALTTFQTAPELSGWREKYGQRAKAYPYEDFQHTGAAFKLDQDRTFSQTGFVALVQPTAPDGDDKAPVKSIYEFSSAAQFAGALRDVDDRYNPNQPDAPGAPAEWQTWHYAANAVLIFVAVICGAAALAKRAARKRAGLI